jgi:hypothetical protein
MQYGMPWEYYWSSDYLVDNQGYIRYSHIGEGGYGQTEQVINSTG